MTILLNHLRIILLTHRLWTVPLLNKTLVKLLLKNSFLKYKSSTNLHQVLKTLPWYIPIILSSKTPKILMKDLRTLTFYPLTISHLTTLLIKHKKESSDRPSLPWYCQVYASVIDSDYSEYWTHNLSPSQNSM